MTRLMLCLSVMLALVLATHVHAAETMQIEGSTTVGPICDAYAEVMAKMYPDLKITVNKTGSGNGAAALVDKRCEIAMMSRFMKDEEFKKAVENGVFPVAHALAMDALCVIVNPSNNVGELKIEQIRDIYLGKIKNWKELGGTDMPIVVISRDTSSGTYESFDHFVMSKQKMGGGVEYVNSNPQAHARVKSTAGAIGYVGLGFIDDAVKALKVNGITPSNETAKNGTYPLSRPLFLFTNGYPKLGSMTYKFCTFHLTEEGQDIIKKKGFIPVTNY